MGGCGSIIAPAQPATSASSATEAIYKTRQPSHIKQPSFGVPQTPAPTPSLHMHTTSIVDGLPIVRSPLIVAAPTLPPSLLYAIPGYSAHAEVNMATHGVMLDSWKVLLAGETSFLRTRREQKEIAAGVVSTSGLSNLRLPPPASSAAGATGSAAAAATAAGGGMATLSPHPPSPTPTLSARESSNEPPKSTIATATSATSPPLSPLPSKFSPALVFYETFYSKLSALHAPSSAVFSHGGVLRKSRGLLRMVASMLELDGVSHTSRLQATAAGHVHHGAEPNMYVAVLHSLLLTLKELLAETWTKDVEGAWTTCCSFSLNAMIPTAIKEHRPVVVIVGGGYGGCMLAQKLSARRNARVILLDRKKYWFHCLGGPRAVVSPDWTKKWAFHPYNADLLGQHTHFVSGDVTEVTPTGVYVHGWSAPLPFHYLVLATGSSYAFPGKLALVDRQGAENLYKNAGEQIKKSHRCVIVGGGPCGVELAGEVEEAFRIANDADQRAYENGVHEHKLEPRTVTLVQRNTRLSVNFPVEMSIMCCDKLRARGVNVMLNCEALLPAATLDAYHTNKVSYVSGRQLIPTSTGTDIESDLMFLCAGTQINSKCFEGMVGPNGINKLDVDRRIIVGPHLQVGHYENIFAIGDASAAEVTLVGSALSQAVYLADTIGAIEEKRDIKDYPLHQTNRSLGVSLGSQDGVVLNPRINNGVIFDGALAVEHKSRDMAAHFVWSMLNLPLRTEVNWNEKDVVNEDIQALSASMRISIVEARKILMDGLPGMTRAAVDTYT